MPAATESATMHAEEVARGERFEFGRNWSAFLRVLDDERVSEAAASLRDMLGVESLRGRTFLDLGSGSGLFSLAARNLGADRVHSIDLDPDSVACTLELRRRRLPDDPAWTVEQGSVLDEALPARLGRWDVVYSWGVLHHTGDMWRGLGIAASMVAGGGLLHVALYNDQGFRTTWWRHVKQTYNRLPPGLRLPFLILVIGPRELRSFVFALVTGSPRRYVRTWTHYKQGRGMSRWHDIVDWVGGLPFEVAAPEEVLAFLRPRGFVLERMSTCGGSAGCNEYVFSRG